MELISEGLKQYLALHPEVTEVFFDGKGQWSFAPCILYPTRKTAEEILTDKAHKKADVNEKK